jgi:hypothetical protein
LVVPFVSYDAHDLDEFVPVQFFIEDVVYANFQKRLGIASDAIDVPVDLGLVNESSCLAWEAAPAVWRST